MDYPDLVAAALGVELVGYSGPNMNGGIYWCEDLEDLPEEFRSTWIPLFRIKALEPR